MLAVGRRRFVWAACVAVIGALLAMYVVNRGDAHSASVDPATVNVDRAAPRAACSNASARLGSRPGSIDVWLKCNQRSRIDPVRFEVQRGRNTGQVHPGIVSFRRYPVVRASSGRSYHGRCERGPVGIVCKASPALGDSGPATVAARVWVRSDRACDLEIGVTSDASPPCRRVCSLDATVAILFSGLPRGC